MLSTKNGNEEVWKPVPGYEEEGYEVSTWGRVKGKYGKLLRPDDNGVGYLRVWLRKKHSRKAFLVHRLVLLTFVGPCPAGYVADHIDRNTKNNRLENLRFIPAWLNAPRRKLTPRTVKNIRAEYAWGMVTQQELADRYGVDRSLISRIVNKKRWKAVAEDEPEAPTEVTLDVHRGVIR